MKRIKKQIQGMVCIFIFFTVIWCSIDNDHHDEIHLSFVAKARIVIICLYCFSGHPPYTFNFRVKFYAAEPNTLSEELTRFVTTVVN